MSIRISGLILLICTFPICSFSIGSESAAQNVGKTSLRVPLAIDVQIGEARAIKLPSGREIELKVLGLEETRDAVLGVVRRALVQLTVDGEEAVIESGFYNLPRALSGLRIDCPVTRGFREKTHIDHWALRKDVRLRIWEETSGPLLEPGSFAYPLDQRWFAGLTWIDNEPVSIPSAAGKVYYHAGIDLGGSEGRTVVLAASDGIVVSARGKTIDIDEANPVAARHDVLYLRDARGWYYRYSHFNSIDETIRPGVRVKLGQRLGLLGKEGGSGGWTHLHFEIKSRQPSGEWGTQAAYAYLREAYLREHPTELMAVARPHLMTRVGEEVTLDASLSWSKNDKIREYVWSCSDGKTRRGVVVSRSYKSPGTYSEVLRIKDAGGAADFDFLTVRVAPAKDDGRWPAYLHAAYHPTRGLRVGQSIEFKARSFRTSAGWMEVDFGDGSSGARVRGDGCADQHAKDGYSVVTHKYSKPGVYVVSFETHDDSGYRAMTHLSVTVK